MITRRRILLERGLVLFINDDQTKMRAGGEDRAAGSHNNLHPPLGNLLPMPVTFGVPQMTVQDGHRRKPALKTPDRLRSQTDFRHQHDRLPPITDDLTNGLDIDFRFAAARYTMQQQRAMFTAPQCRVNNVQRSGLIRIHLQIDLNGPVIVGQAEVAGPNLHPLNETLLTQGVHRSRTAAGSLRDFIHRHGSRGQAEKVEHRHLLVRQLQTGPLLPRGRAELNQRHHPRPRLILDPRWNDRLQHLAPAAQVMLPNPAGQFEHPRGQQGELIDDRRQHFQPRPVCGAPGRGRASQPHAIPDLRLISAPKRHLHTLASLQLAADVIRNAVQKRLVDRQIEDNFRTDHIALIGDFPGGQGIRKILRLK